MVYLSNRAGMNIRWDREQLKVMVRVGAVVVFSTSGGRPVDQSVGCR